MFWFSILNDDHRYTHKWVLYVIYKSVFYRRCTQLDDWSTEASCYGLINILCAFSDVELNRHLGKWILVQLKFTDSMLKLFFFKEYMGIYYLSSRRRQQVPTKWCCLYIILYNTISEKPAMNVSIYSHNIWPTVVKPQYKELEIIASRHNLWLVGKQVQICKV